jgi:hypothetical protein
MVRDATKDDVDIFINKIINNDDIYPYMSTSKYFGKFEIPEDDWSGLLLTNDNNTFLCKIKIFRSEELGMSISLYALSPISAGRALLVIGELIKRYKPRYVDSVVHSSNIKSLKLNKKLLGEPWGREPNGAWNSKTGEYDDLVYFRKLFG